MIDWLQRGENRQGFFVAAIFVQQESFPNRSVGGQKLPGAQNGPAYQWYAFRMNRSEAEI
ncbi:MAG: hypothetical protein LUH20_00565 [Lachnospiraceae bacterium]|nr:hypothetical protein [Lachnospiraceae bacterium]